MLWCLRSFYPTNQVLFTAQCHQHVRCNDVFSDWLPIYCSVSKEAYWVLYYSIYLLTMLISQSIPPHCISMRMTPLSTLLIFVLLYLSIWIIRIWTLSNWFTGNDLQVNTMKTQTLQRFSLDVTQNIGTQTHHILLLFLQDGHLLFI